MQETSLAGTTKRCHMRLQFRHSYAYGSTFHHQIQRKMLRLLLLAQVNSLFLIWDLQKVQRYLILSK